MPLRGTPSEYWCAESKRHSFEDYYIMGSELGTGSTCTVFNCQEKSTGLKWAVKILNKKGNKKFVVAEIGTLLTLQHPNVIRLKEVFENLTHIYMVLELVTGGELFDRIVEKGFYSENDAAECTTQMLQGVKYLHDNDVVHRDIKPENLLYENTSENAQLKIADFGLAKIAHPQSLLKTVCGTPGYCAPEVLKNSAYTSAVDMWAVGVIVYILLCGYEPFYAKHDAKVFRRILKCDYKFHHEWWCQISETAKDFISHILLLNPAKRMTAAQALNHPWVKGFAIRNENLLEAQQAMRRLNARRRLKAVAGAVMAFRIKRLSTLTGETMTLMIGGDENVVPRADASTSKTKEHSSER